MPRKGGGRKAFLKSAKPEPEDDDHTPVAAPPAAEKQPPKPAEPNPDLAARFLKDEPSTADANTVVPASAASAANGAGDSTAAIASKAEKAADDSETKGQLVQRHKRELKAHKEHTKKLGKKRKDEIEELDKAIAARHKAELEAWEAANDEGDEEDATLVAPTAGLYDLKIGTDERQPKKPTKAQKRREQRAAEEAERDARIAGEKARQGPSEKELEEAALNELLLPLGLEIHDIPADGNCMYRAVEDQLAASGADPPQSVTELREETASYMRAFPDDFKPFVVKEDDGEKGDPDEQYEAYCQEVEDTAAWGGQVELQALAHAVERHIMVYAVGLPVVELGSEYKGKQRSLQLCYLRHAYGLGEHYNSLRPAAGVS